MLSIVNVGLEFARQFTGLFLAVVSCDSVCTSVASRALYIEELFKHWSCSGLEGPFTGSHIDHSFLAGDVKFLAVEVTAADTGISRWV